MTNKLTNILFFSLLFLLTTVLVSSDAFCQQPQSLEEGISLYKAGKYEDAINSLSKTRQEDPGNSTAAFYLGLACKQTMDYEAASVQFKDAVTLTPRIKEALIELIDVSLQLGRLDEANKWIAVAETENVFPAKAAYLKGLVLEKEGKHKEAAASFEKAKSLDPAISQASDIQIAITHLKESEIKNAKVSFQSAITADPQSDLAGFARQYLARVDETLYAQRPFHFTLGVFGQYDDNLILNPTDPLAALPVSNQGSLVLNSNFRVNYSPKFKGPWLLNAYYAVSSGLHKRYNDRYDSLINTASIAPGYDFGKYALNLSATYSYALVRNTDYEKYSGNLSVGPMFRLAVGNSQLVELFAGYADNKYYQPTLISAENRDSNGVSAYASWIWLFTKDSFLNFRYQFQDQNTTGINWDNTSHSLSANVVIPASEKVKLQFSGEFTRMDFTNENSIFDIKRKDDISNLSAGLSWTIYKNTNFIVQYTRIDNGSNIPIYDYLRNLYTAGLEYRF
jgi:tetratricopeptide (TPR) repeat protein